MASSSESKLVSFFMLIVSGKLLLPALYRGIAYKRCHGYDFERWDKPSACIVSEGNCVEHRENERRGRSQIHKGRFLRRLLEPALLRYKRDRREGTQREC